MGMWKEPGARIHAALKHGYSEGLGYGESLMLAMEQTPEQFPFKSKSLLYCCLQLEIPCTVHVTIGTDAIQQHPMLTSLFREAQAVETFNTYARPFPTLNGGIPKLWLNRYRSGGFPKSIIDCWEFRSSCNRS